MNEKISIIVPVYNAETTLDRCIRALIEQTYENIEIILINDGSKDGSLQICRRYEAEDSRIRVIDKPNGGVSSARNAGLDIATGEFIMFCDSDDWAEPDWCQELISHYEEGCLVMCGHYVEGEQDFLPYEIKADKLEVYPFIDIMQLRSKFFTCLWNKIYLSSTIRRYNLRFHEKLHNGEDYLFNLHYISKLHGHVIRLTKCVFHYVWPNGNTLSSSISDDYFDQLTLFHQHATTVFPILEIHERNGLLIFYAELFDQYEKGIMHVLHSSKSFLSRICYVNKIMKTSAYRQCIARIRISSNAVYSILWKQRNCYGILLWCLVRRLRRREQ